jgi:hypothetical protein
MQKVSEDIALKEFERWFESKKLPQSKRKNEYETIENEMIQAICDGLLVVNEDNTLTLQLVWPLSSPQQLTELKFKHRIQTSELQTKTAWAKDSREKKITATIATLTDQVGGIIGALDPVDYDKAACIASYFF